MRKFRQWILTAAFLCLAVLLPQVKAEAAQRLFDIVVKDGRTTQVIEMKYGKTPYGYTSYYANRSVIYVSEKSKSVTFSVRKNTSGRYGNFHFASVKMKPGDNPQGNLFTYTVDGKRRAWMFTVQKYVEPKIQYLKISVPRKGSAFKPKKKNYVKMKTFIKTDVPVKTILRIFDERGKIVYKKSYGESSSKTYMFEWDGKPSKKNTAKLKTSEYVPAGEYTVKVSVYPQIGKKVKEVTRETKLTVIK
ncbi:hypothetical protein AALA00_07940 [Lachnospiraceae bacterium 46-15]